MTDDEREVARYAAGLTTPRSDNRFYREKQPAVSEREPDAFMVEWVRRGETWVHCHADEPTAVDQARLMKGTCTPLYRLHQAAADKVNLSLTHPQADRLLAHLCEVELHIELEPENAAELDSMRRLLAEAIGEFDRAARKRVSA